MSNTNEFQLPVNEDKVIDKVIDVYMWISEDLNTAEVIRAGQHLIDIANRRATDVEVYYLSNRLIEAENPDYVDPGEDIILPF